jgi:hypothetical protein
LRFVLIFNIDLFPVAFSQKSSCPFRFTPIFVANPADVIHWLPDECLLMSTNHETPHFGVSSILLVFHPP